MDPEIVALRSQLARVSVELATAQHTIRKLENRRVRCSSAIAFCVVATLLALGPWGTAAQQGEPPSALEEKIMLDVLDLMRRVTALEKGRHRVTAPFEVVDAANRPILSVGASGDDRGLEVYASNGSMVAAVVAKGPDGHVVVKGPSSKGTLATVENNVGLQLEASDEKAYLRSDELQMASGDKKFTAQASSLALSDGDQPRAELGAGDQGNMRLKIMNGGQQIVGLGESPALGNSGVLAISDASGHVVALVAATGAGRGSVNVYGKSDSALASIGVDDNGQGVVAVRDGAGKAVAFLTGSSSGQGGNVTATNPAGDGVFSAGWNGEEGAACVNLKNGMWCMGKNLPLQHGGGSD
jgi:hypothetical protein